MPLVIVLGFSAAKEALEDFNRYRADSAANNTPTTKVEGGQQIKEPAMALQPGQIVYIPKGGKFFVDVVLLSSSYDDGTAFIETAELDGETNLKRKSALTPTMNATTDSSASNLLGMIECEHPNENLHSFEGRLSLQGVSTPSPINMLHFVPRGSVLRNTDFVYAVCIYAGPNTKIMKNLKQGKLKSSSLEARLNTLVLWAFVYNAILLVVSIILEYVYYNNVKSGENFQTDEFGHNWYLGFQGQDTSYVSLCISLTDVVLTLHVRIARLGHYPILFHSLYLRYSHFPVCHH